MSNPIEPPAVVKDVEQYVRTELSDATKYENRTPLDESGIYALHALAAGIYALGFADGEFAAEQRSYARAERSREQQQN